MTQPNQSPRSTGVPCQSQSQSRARAKQRNHKQTFLRGRAKQHDKHLVSVQRSRGNLPNLPHHAYRPQALT